jgi:hypothetical protein
MIGYDDYINKIKGAGTAADYDGLYRAIERKFVGRQKSRVTRALAGAAALLVISLAAFLSYPLLSGGNEQLMSYVFDQQPAVTDGPVIDYVYSDGGTF